MFAIVVVVLLIMSVSFFCSLAEAALYAVPASRVEALRHRGATSGVRLAALRARVGRPITAILLINTFITMMGAAIIGSLVGAAFGGHAVLPFSFAVTVAILVFSEILPKSLGVGYAGALAPLLAWPIQISVWALYPVVSASEWLTRRIAPRRGGHAPAEDEIIALAHLGALHGSILPEEEKWVHGVLRLNNKTAGDLMTPRTVLTTLEGQRTIGEIEKEIPSLRHSRLPVTTDEGPDQVTGVVLRRDLVDAAVQDKHDLRVQDLARPALFVPASMRGNRLLSTFIANKTHLAIVVDEYGGTMGVVTLEDVIEAILGAQIVGEFDPHPDMRAYARSRAKAKKP